MAKQKDITLLVDSLIALYTLEPTLRHLVDQKKQLEIFTKPEVKAKIEELFPEEQLEFKELSGLLSRFRLLNKFHTILLTLITSRNFSFQYRLLTHPKTKSFSIFNWGIYFYAKIFPKVKNPKISGILHKVFSKFNKLEFESDRVVVVSRFSIPVILCSKNFKTYTIVESWDHPVKLPIGYRSEGVFVWNEDLKTDWILNQGDQNVQVAYPFKLRDWFEDEFTKEIEEAKNKIEQDTLLYAIGSSSFSTVNDLYVSELIVIDKLCRAAERAGKKVFLKPKPNGKQGDFDEFKKYPNVTIGAYGNAGSTSGYYLDKAYNRHRLNETASSEFVVNTITTFALDAALMDKPILQLDLRKCREIKGVAECQFNHHLEEYIVKEGAVVCNSLEQMEEEIYQALINPSIIDEKRKVLKEWISPKKSLKNALESIYLTIFKD